LTGVSVALPVGAAVLAAGCAWPASRVVTAYTQRTIAPLGLAVLMAALAGAAGTWTHPWPAACAACWLAIVSVPLAIIDVLARRLPDRLTAAAFAGIAAFLVTAAATDSGWHPLARAGEGAAGLAAAFVLLAIVRPGSAGLGDAKLGLSIGALAAWFGWAVLVAALFICFLLAACYAVWLLAFRRAGIGATIAFGPFLLAGCLAAVLLTSASGSQW
jgi:leader peptidase (prepilin peptidase) / N-methyltransferase